MFVVAEASSAMDPIPPPGAMSKTSGPVPEARAGRIAASYPAMVIYLNVTWMCG